MVYSNERPLGLFYSQVEPLGMVYSQVSPLELVYSNEIPLGLVYSQVGPLDLQPEGCLVLVSNQMETMLRSATRWKLCGGQQSNWTLRLVNNHLYLKYKFTTTIFLARTTLQELVFFRLPVKGNIFSHFHLYIVI